MTEKVIASLCYGEIGLVEIKASESLTLTKALDLTETLIELMRAELERQGDD